MSDNTHIEKPTVYLDTTIPSYLVARPSRDLVIAAHQQITHEWWYTARTRFDLFVSEAVVEELGCGDPDLVEQRLAVIEGFPVLAPPDGFLELMRVYAEQLGLSGRAQSDLPHFAFAVLHRMDYLVTWNCTHIANGEIIRRLNEVNRALDQFTPVIVTPIELLTTPSGDAS